MTAQLEQAVVDLYELRSLSPLARDNAPLSQADARKLLDEELKTVGLRALVAIAKGWDTRRLGFANESAHPYEQEVAAILGMNEGHARAQLAAATERLMLHEHLIAQDKERRGARTPLGRLAADFELSPLAIDILSVAAAPSLWGEAARLYGVIANEPTRPLVDELLVSQILGGNRYDIAQELEPSSPLCRYGLLQLGARPRPFASIVVDPVVLARLRGDSVDFGASSATSVRPADRELDELLMPADLIFMALRYLTRDLDPRRPARVVLRGRSGTGRRTLMAALAKHAGRELGVIDASRLPRKLGEFLEALTIELRRSLLRGFIPCVIRIEDVSFEEPHARELLADVLRLHPGPVALRLPTDAPIPLDPGYVTLDVPLPSETERLTVWQQALTTWGIEVEHPAELAARYRVGPGTIHSVVESVARDRAEEGRLGGNATVDLERRMRQTREVVLGKHARRVERLAGWDSLVLPEDSMYSLRELVARVRHRRRVYDEWGFDRTMATSRGLSALFQGPPGTGKTMVAGVIARELGLELYQLDLSKVVSKWIGETERNLSAIFDAAEDGQVVLLFDEADSLFAKRTEVKSSNDRYANLEVNYLLQRLDSFEGIAILTTNFGGSIDPALMRRLSFRLMFPFPDEETREQLWRVHLPKELPISGALNLKTLASKYRLSGGYIRNACLRAAFLAAEDGNRLGQVHLERAITLVFAELGKLSTTGSVE
jgi:AAA+ superfamily predicted ATPase